MVARKPKPPVIATGAPRRTVAVAPLALPLAKVLQSNRAPAQLQLFLRPSGLR